jgi:chromosome segregation ATPase
MTRSDFNRDVPPAIADPRGRIQELQTDFTTAEEYALALERTTEALAAENRQLGHRYAHLAAENRRLRGAAEQMRGELLAFNKLLDAVRAIAEQINRDRQSHGQELGGLSNELATERRPDQQELVRVNDELLATKARLASVYSSLCWRLTAPLRWCDDARRRVVSWLRKGLGGDE